MSIHPALTRFFDPLVLMGRVQGPMQVSEQSETAGMDGDVDFEITGDDGWVWHMSIDRGKVLWRRGGSLNPRGTISMSSETFCKLLRGDLQYSTATMAGRVRVRGDGHYAFLGGILVARFREPEKEPGLRGALGRMWRKRVLEAMTS